MTNLDPKAVLREVESLLEEFKPDDLCVTCNLRRDEHYRMGTRNIWVGGPFPVHPFEKIGERR